ncbi:uncharacterized protein osk [Venturia canescens]|uniref:uncharacterized protein osk n=1 Tax=Venturia canescens TaxID=32260 RepID=UPI001C9CDB34|nr:uncharacterized protein LOC122407501 [Venturia canescens]
MEETTKILKSCVVAHQGGVPQENLDDEFYKFTGNYIPYLALGFKSLYEFLGSVKDLVKKRNSENNLVYTVCDPKIAHISSMVEKQKNPCCAPYRAKIQTNKRKVPREFRRGRKANKRQKNEGRNRIGQWNPIRDRYHSSEEGEPDQMSGSDEWFDDEYNHPVRIIERPQKLDVVHEPLVNGKQLIGDDFFLQLAIRNVGATVYRNGPCTALSSGLCKSGQTIKECTRRLKKVEVLANKLVVMLGAEDIYRGHSSDEMIEDMEELLLCLENRHAFSKSAITLCTIPPLANLHVLGHKKKLENLKDFNSWIIEKTNAFCDTRRFSGIRYNLVDFHTKNTTVHGSTEYEFFQLDARMVSGTPQPYVLWSHRGRRLAMNLLRAGS